MSTKFGILTVSDSCYAGEKSDTAGTQLEEAVKRRFANAQVFRKLVADEKDDIISVLREWTDTMDVVLTTGGTGFSQRDVTPEATRAVIEKEAPGLAYAMVSRSLKVTEMAMLPRAVCGIRKKSLIVNLPGSAKAAVECFGFIQEAIAHAIAWLTENKDLVSKEHKTFQTETAENPFTDSKVKIDKIGYRHHKNYPLLEVDKVQEIIFRETAATTQVEIVPFQQSINRILAEDVCTLEPLPPSSTSTIDGYAVKFADGTGVRSVIEVAAAGDAPLKVSIKDGEAVRVSKGAPIPEGADTVVNVESTVVNKSADNSTELKIEIRWRANVGQNIRMIGTDMEAGIVVLNRYNRISTEHVGILAMLGITEVKVMTAPLIGVISAGNEVQHPCDKLEAGQISDYNKYNLMNFLRKYSYQPRDCGYARDNPNSIKRALEDAFAENDFVITIGEISKGGFDIIRTVLIEDFNAIIYVGRVNMKSEKPATFATLLYNGKLKIFFGLSSNPELCCITCILFVIPALRYFERSNVTLFPIVDVAYKSLFVGNNELRPDYERVMVRANDGSLNGTSEMNPVINKLNLMAGANGLVIKQYRPSGVSGSYLTIVFDQLF